MGAMAFRQEQRGVARAMAAALLVALGVLGGVAIWPGAPETASFLLRLRFALRADILVIGWLVAAIANVARLRFFSERDIGGSGGSEAASFEVRTAGAILQNTAEQAGVAIVVHLIVAATFERSEALVTALVALFALGRLLFWTGYRRGAKARAFGFALTFYPNVLALVACGAIGVQELVA